MRELLLISNSTNPGEGYLEHCGPALSAFLAGAGPVLFVPFALADHDGYTAKFRARMAELGHEVVGLHEVADPRAEVASAGAMFCGGGNSFRLLRAMRERELLRPLRDRVAAGELRYSGASAGSNLACPTIRTTNDMPIVESGGLDALGLVPFQLNPHYLDPVEGLAHMGETREQRLAEFHEENTLPVVGLREGSWLRVTGDECQLEGKAPARIFRRGVAPEEVGPGRPLPPDLVADRRP